LLIAAYQEFYFRTRRRAGRLAMLHPEFPHPIFRCTSANVTHSFRDPWGVASGIERTSENI
jgi:hypothetical protein